jgi:hypothetical protein
MVDHELELVLTGELDFNVQVTEVLVQGTAGTGDSDITGLDGDLDTLGDDEFVVLVDILYIGKTGINRLSFLPTHGCLSYLHS